MPPRTADDELICLAVDLLKEMKELEVGYYIRDLGYNFPVTMDALKKAKEITKNTK